MISWLTSCLFCLQLAIFLLEIKYGSYFNMLLQRIELMISIDCYQDRLLVKNIFMLYLQLNLFKNFTLFALCDMIIQMSDNFFFSLTEVI